MNEGKEDMDVSRCNCSTGVSISNMMPGRDDINGVVKIDDEIAEASDDINGVRSNLG